jgi:hypothetical protein
MDVQNSNEKQSLDLTPEDYEEALDRMKRDLALLQLKRRLRQPDLSAREILEITREICRLQLAQPDALDAL